MLEMHLIYLIIKYISNTVHGNYEYLFVTFMKCANIYLMYIFVIFIYLNSLSLIYLIRNSIATIS